MIKRQKTTVNLKTTYIDLTRNYDNISLDDYGFDFAFKLTLNGDPIYDRSYFYYEVQNIYSWWAEDENGITKRYKITQDLQMGP